MTAADFLHLVVSRLERADISYALGGSIAAMAYGEPRSTMDVDVVVVLDPDDVDGFLSLFPTEDFYVSPDRVREVVGAGGSFNVIHPESGMKIDFFVASDAIEDRQIARRIRKEALPGLKAYFSPPEELVLKKLEYFIEGGSEKHVRDIRAMLAVSPESIDLELLQALVERFGLDEAWERVRKR
jgi:hypothetical protein